MKHMIAVLKLTMQELGGSMHMTTMKQFVLQGVSVRRIGPEILIDANGQYLLSYLHITTCSAGLDQSDLIMPQADMHS